MAQPVNKGSHTGHLALMPGALYSTGLIFGIWTGKSFHENLLSSLFSLNIISFVGLIVVPR